MYGVRGEKELEEETGDGENNGMHQPERFLHSNEGLGTATEYKEDKETKDSFLE